MIPADAPPVGSRVRVVRGISEIEKELHRQPQRVYVVERYSRPHGYAVIRRDDAGFDCGSWHVHPEALETL